MLSYNFDGKRFDCGSKLGYLQAQVEFALEHNEVSKDFRAYLNNLLNADAKKVVAMKKKG